MLFETQYLTLKVKVYICLYFISQVNQLVSEVNQLAVPVSRLKKRSCQEISVDLIIIALIIKCGLFPAAVVF